MPKKTRNTVGATPISTYATWDEHREAIRREADGNRKKRLVRPK